MATASDRAVVDALMERFYDRVYAFAKQLTDAATAEDVTQDVFVKLLTMPDLRTREIRVSYLIKIAHNRIRGQGRTASRFQKYLGKESPRAASMMESKLGPQMRVPMYDAEEIRLAALSPNEEAAVRLTVLQGLSLRETAEALGASMSAVTNWKYRGLRKLSERMAPTAA
ncbi:MAG: RNA polymerase sigma factor [Phycisphaerales bacterium]